MYDVIILMAGKSLRFNQGKNKNLFKINNKEIFKHSIDKFQNSNIILVCNKDDYDYVNNLYSNEQVKVIVGGAERFNSVYNALKYVNSKYVIIHDAARPNFSIEKVNKMLVDIENYSGAMLYTKMTNSLYKRNFKSQSSFFNHPHLKVLKREEYIMASTPQILKTSIYKKILEKFVKKKSFITDDISLLVKSKKSNILLVEDNSNNIKITNYEDYLYLKWCMENV